MAYEAILNTITLVATGTIAQYTAVSIGGNDAAPTCVGTTSATDPLVIGVAQNAAVAGESVTVAVGGITKMVAGAAVATYGLRIASDAAGKGRVAVATNVPIGISVAQGSAADKYLSVLLGRPNIVLA